MNIKFTVEIKGLRLMSNNEIRVLMHELRKSAFTAGYYAADKDKDSFDADVEVADVGSK